MKSGQGCASGRRCQTHLHIGITREHVKVGLLGGQTGTQQVGGLHFQQASRYSWFRNALWAPKYCGPLSNGGLSFGGDFVFFSKHMVGPPHCVVSHWRIQPTAGGNQDFLSWVGNSRMPRASWIHCSTPLYIRDLGLCGWGCLWESRNRSPEGTRDN